MEQPAGVGTASWLPPVVLSSAIGAWACVYRAGSLERCAAKAGNANGLLKCALVEAQGDALLLGAWTLVAVVIPAASLLWLAVRPRPKPIDEKAVSKEATPRHAGACARSIEPPTTPEAVAPEANGHGINGEPLGKEEPEMADLASPSSRLTSKEKVMLNEEWMAVRDVLTANKFKSLKTLYGNLADLHEHVEISKLPSTIFRFWAARNGDIVKAEEMFRTHVAWRSHYNVEDRMKCWSLEVAEQQTERAKLVDQHKIHDILGNDRFGLPVYLFRWSVFDIDGAERHLGRDLVMQIIIGIHEHVAEELRKCAKNRFVPGALFVWDIGDYGVHGVPNYWGRMWALVNSLPHIAKLLEANYPEIVRKIIVVRSGVATQLLYKAAVPFMPKGTLRKCSMYGWRASSWVKDLRMELPGVDLPEWLTCERDDAIAEAKPKGGLYV